MSDIVTQCHIISQNVMHNVIPCYTISYHITQCQTVLYNILLFIHLQTILNNIKLCCKCNTVIYNVIPCYTMLHNVKLQYMVIQAITLYPIFNIFIRRSQEHRYDIDMIYMLRYRMFIIKHISLGKYLMIMTNQKSQ